MNSSRAEKALNIISLVATERENDIFRYYAHRTEDLDDKADAASPIVDSFYIVGGNESILKMTNCTSPEIRLLYFILEHCMNIWSSNGRGKKFNKPMNVLFTMVVVMKDKRSWDHLGHMFQIKRSTFILLIQGFKENIHDLCVDSFVTESGRHHK